MTPTRRAHILMFSGGGLFAGGAVALAESAAWWIVLPLFLAGVACECAGLWTHWRNNRPK
jgi:hypothetical protein